MPAEPVARGLGAPDLLAVARPKRVETAVVSAEEDAATIEGERTLHGATGVEGPDRLPVDGAEAVDVPLRVADVDPVAHDQRRRLAGPEVLLPAEPVRGPGCDDEQLAVSSRRGIPAARVPVEERLVDGAPPEPVDGRGRGLAPADMHGPQPATVPRRDGVQVSVQAGVVEIVEADRGRELDERRATGDPVAPERRPHAADADVEVLRLAAEHRRDERAWARRRDSLGEGEFGRRPFDAAAEAVLRRVVGRGDAGEEDQDADNDEEAAHPPDDACGGRLPDALRSRRGGVAGRLVRRAWTRPAVAEDA